jgi:hypothetical protein
MDAKNRLHFPGFSPEAAEFLLKEREINGIGVDTLSIDLGASQDFKVHYTMLPANKWGLENLANLGTFPARRHDLRGIAKGKGGIGWAHARPGHVVGKPRPEGSLALLAETSWTPFRIVIRRPQVLARHPQQDLCLG